MSERSVSQRHRRGCQRRPGSSYDRDGRAISSDRYAGASQEINFSTNNDYVDSMPSRYSPPPSLKPYTIPKDRRQKTLLEERPLESREGQFVIDVIKKSLWNPEAITFQYNKLELVNNEVLETEYIAKRKEMREQNRSSSEMSDSFAFLYLRNSDECKELCMNGLTTRKVTTARQYYLPVGASCSIGDKNYGIYLCRCADIITRAVPLHKYGKENIMLLCKIMKGRVRVINDQVQKADTVSSIEPTIDFDSHVSRRFQRGTKMNYDFIYDASQIYLYEMNLDNISVDDDTAIFAKRPRQCLPYAVIHFKAKEISPAKIEVMKPAVKKVPENSSHINTTVTGSIQATMESINLREQTYDESLKGMQYVWRGFYFNKAMFLAEIQLGIFSKNSIRLPLDVSNLCIQHKISWEKLSRIFPAKIYRKPPSKAFQPETEVVGFKFIHAEIRPVDQNMKIQKLHNHWLKHKTAGVCTVNNGFKLFIVPSSIFTDKLGITDQSYPAVLHCIFMKELGESTIFDPVSYEAFKRKQQIALHTRINEDFELKCGNPSVGALSQFAYTASEQLEILETICQMKVAMEKRKESKQGKSSRKLSKQVSSADKIKNTFKVHRTNINVSANSISQTTISMNAPSVCVTNVNNSAAPSSSIAVDRISHLSAMAQDIQVSGESVKINDELLKTAIDFCLSYKRNSNKTVNQAASDGNTAFLTPIVESNDCNVNEESTSGNIVPDKEIHSSSPITFSNQVNVPVVTTLIANNQRLNSTQGIQRKIMLPRVHNLQDIPVRIIGPTTTPLVNVAPKFVHTLPVVSPNMPLQFIPPLSIMPTTMQTGVVRPMYTVPAHVQPNVFQILPGNVANIQQRIVRPALVSASNSCRIIPLPNAALGISQPLSIPMPNVHGSNVQPLMASSPNIILIKQSLPAPSFKMQSPLLSKSTLVSTSNKPQNIIRPILVPSSNAPNSVSQSAPVSLLDVQQKQSILASSSNACVSISKSEQAVMASSSSANGSIVESGQALLDKSITSTISSSLNTLNDNQSSILPDSNACMTVSKSEQAILAPSSNVGMDISVSGWTSSDKIVHSTISSSPNTLNGSQPALVSSSNFAVSIFQPLPVSPPNILHKAVETISTSLSVPSSSHIQLNVCPSKLLSSAINPSILEDVQNECLDSNSRSPKDPDDITDSSQSSENNLVINLDDNMDIDETPVDNMENIAESKFLNNDSTVESMLISTINTENKCSKYIPGNDMNNVDDYTVVDIHADTEESSQDGFENEVVSDLEDNYDSVAMDECSDTLNNSLDSIEYPVCSDSEESDRSDSPSLSQLQNVKEEILKQLSKLSDSCDVSKSLLRSCSSPAQTVIPSFRELLDEQNSESTSFKQQSQSTSQEDSDSSCWLSINTSSSQQTLFSSSSQQSFSSTISQQSTNSTLSCQKSVNSQLTLTSSPSQQDSISSLSQLSSTTEQQSKYSLLEKLSSSSFKHCVDAPGSPDHTNSPLLSRLKSGIQSQLRPASPLSPNIQSLLRPASPLSLKDIDSPSSTQRSNSPSSSQPLDSPFQDDSVSEDDEMEPIPLLGEEGKEDLVTDGKQSLIKELDVQKAEMALLAIGSEYYEHISPTETKSSNLGALPKPPGPLLHKVVPLNLSSSKSKLPTTSASEYPSVISTSPSSLLITVTSAVTSCIAAKDAKIPFLSDDPNEKVASTGTASSSKSIPTSPSISEYQPPLSIAVASSDSVQQLPQLLSMSSSVSVNAQQGSVAISSGSDYVPPQLGPVSSCDTVYQSVPPVSKILPVSGYLPSQSVSISSSLTDNQLLKSLSTALSISSYQSPQHISIPSTCSSAQSLQVVSACSTISCSQLTVLSPVSQACTTQNVTIPVSASCPPSSQGVSIPISISDAQPLQPVSISLTVSCPKPSVPISMPLASCHQPSNNASETASVSSAPFQYEKMPDKVISAELPAIFTKSQVISSESLSSVSRRPVMQVTPVVRSLNTGQWNCKPACDLPQTDPGLSSLSSAPLHRNPSRFYRERSSAAIPLHDPMMIKRTRVNREEADAMFHRKQNEVQLSAATTIDQIKKWMAGGNQNRRRSLSRDPLDQNASANSAPRNYNTPGQKKIVPRAYRLSPTRSISPEKRSYQHSPLRDRSFPSQASQGSALRHRTLSGPKYNYSRRINRSRSPISKSHSPTEYHYKHREHHGRYSRSTSRISNDGEVYSYRHGEDWEDEKFRRIYEMDGEGFPKYNKEKLRNPYWRTGVDKNIDMYSRDGEFSHSEPPMNTNDYRLSGASEQTEIDDPLENTENDATNKAKINNPPETVVNENRRDEDGTSHSKIDSVIDVSQTYRKNGSKSIGFDVSSSACSIFDQRRRAKRKKKLQIWYALKGLQKNSARLLKVFDKSSKGDIDKQVIVPSCISKSKPSIWGSLMRKKLNISRNRFEATLTDKNKPVEPSAELDFIPLCNDNVNGVTWNDKHVSSDDQMCGLAIGNTFTESKRSVRESNGEFKNDAIDDHGSEYSFHNPRKRRFKLAAIENVNH